jgi:hypothetical protein
MAESKLTNILGGIVGFGYFTLGVTAMAAEAVTPGIRQAAVAAGKATLSGLDIADKHISAGVKVLIEYLDHHPGIAAVVSPVSVFRRVAYRQTEDSINRNRAQAVTESTLQDGEAI